MSFRDLDHLAPFEKVLGPGRRSGHCVVFPCPNPRCNGEIWVENEKPGKLGLFICFHCGLRGSHISFAKEHNLEVQPLKIPTPKLPSTVIPIKLLAVRD